MNVHDYATRQAARDRAAGLGTKAPDAETVYARFRAQAAASGNPEIIAAVEVAIAADKADRAGRA